MYVPKAFREDDVARLHGFIRAWSFALLVTDVDGVPSATHLPFVLDADGTAHGRLIGHVARANPHWQAFDGTRQALAVFGGPHAYVSPTWYATSPAVPTWNYAAIHAYGRPRVLEGAEATRDAVERLVRQHDAAWHLGDQPAEFVTGMLRGIVAFELPIDRLEGKLKLSQNRPAADRPGILRALRAGGEAERAVADLMESWRGASRV
jgi:transcriptional regulator